MTWWLLLIIVVGGLWLLGTTLLTINHLVRHKGLYDSYPPLLQSIYDSLWWPVYTAFYGIDGLRREITGRP